MTSEAARIIEDTFWYRFAHLGWQAVRLNASHPSLQHDEHVIIVNDRIGYRSPVCTTVDEVQAVYDSLRQQRPRAHGTLWESGAA